MDKSPLPKRQKFDGTSFNEVIDELETIIHIRDIIRGVVEPIYSSEIPQLQKKMTKFELELNKVETYDIPDMDPILQDFRTRCKDYEKRVQKIQEHIPLLNRLEQKKNCPIAKIIDEI